MTYTIRYIPIKVNADGTKYVGIEKSTIEEAEEVLIDMLNRGIPFLSAQIDEVKTENIFDPEFEYGKTPASYLTKTHHYNIATVKEI